MDDQLELFSRSPFSIRLRITEALNIFWEFYWKHLPSSKTTRIHFKRLSRYFEKHYLDTITKTDAENMRRYLSSIGLKSSTINKYQMIMTRLYSKFEEYRESGVVNDMDFSKLAIPLKIPFQSVKKVNESQFARVVSLTPYQYNYLKQFADQEMRDDLDFLVFTQLRLGDARAIKYEDVDWHNYQIRGVQNKTVTTNNPGGIPYTVDLTKEIETIIHRRKKDVIPGNPLFSYKNWQKRFGSLRKLAKMPFLQTRDLRKLLSTWLADKGFDTDTRAVLLGHTTDRMEKIYAPRSPEHIRKAKRLAVEAFSK